MTTSFKGFLEVADVLRGKERILTKVFDRSTSANEYVANEIANTIRSRKEGPPVVLTLSTGSTPQGVYKELVRMHKQDGLSFKNVAVFGLDEYLGLAKTQLQSRAYFLEHNLFKHIDINPANIHILDGVFKGDNEELCRSFEATIRQYGGVDICLLGIGGGGHLGSIEPGASVKGTTSIVHLDRKTRKAVESDFFGLEFVPKGAATVGISNILESKRIFLLAFGEHKAKIIRRCAEDPCGEDAPASFLQIHKTAEFVIDEAASDLLTRNCSPWVVVPNSSSFKLNWDNKLVQRAVIWLSLKLKTSVLKLREDDYIKNNLEQLLDARGHPHKINLEVFNYLKSTITGWPGGKPSRSFLQMTPETRKSTLNLAEPGGATTREPVDYIISNQTHINPEGNPYVDNTIYPKRVLIFSPHPDDDVISMGGTLIRLVEQGHKVSVAYQTSGNIAVWDDDVKRFMNFVQRFSEMFGVPDGAKEFLTKMEDEVESDIDSKSKGHPDTQRVRQIKGLIRETEATAGARYSGVKKEDIYFLNLPFYETGTVLKKEMGDDDITIIQKLLLKIKPHQIYAAGDLSDPHGTHRVCLEALLAAVDRVKHDEWFKPCQIWLYRGAWQEWEPHEVSMAIPMSPTELLQKRYAIYKHQSQKDPAPFPGGDPREFWQRSEARNRDTASVYDTLGMTEYEGMEAFVLYDPFSTHNKY